MHESKVKNDFKAAANVEKPRQLFWEKRLNGRNLAFLKIPFRVILEDFYGKVGMYESFSDVGEIRVWFASKILTPCRMH